MTHQLDLFPKKSWGADEVIPPDPELARRVIHDVTGQLRTAETFPWRSMHLRSWKIVVPQMSGCLPDEEARDLVAAFRRELDAWGVGGDCRDASEALPRRRTAPE